jgi:hypothetical protein
VIKIKMSQQNVAYIRSLEAESLHVLYSYIRKGRAPKSGRARP